MSVLEITEGMQYSTTDSELPFEIDVSNWDSSVDSVEAAQAYDETADDQDVTSTVFPVNSPSADGTTITLSPLKDLVKGHTYRIEVRYNLGSAVREFYFRVKCEV